MRKTLCTFLLMLATLYGKSQVILNEIYVNPATQVPVKNGPKVDHHEFFELYNNSPNTTINLDCYTIVSVTRDKPGNRIVYVLDLPSFAMLPKTYFVAASTSPFNVQGDESLNLNVNADFVWSNKQSGTLTKYEVATNNTITTTTQITGQLSDFFPVPNSSDLSTAVFLFKDGIYQSGFLGGFTLSIADALRLIQTLPSMPGSCGNIINFSQVSSVESVSAAAGTDNGYARTTDGQCAGWTKTANNVSHTPKRTNGLLTTTVTTGTLTTTQGYPCGTQVVFNVTGPTTFDALPVNVYIYYDKNTIGTFEPTTDVLISTIPVNTYTEGPHTFQLPEAYKNLPLLIVYETKYGCYDRIYSLTPQSSGTFTTSQKNICNQQIDFTITSATGDAINYSLPIQVQLYDVSNGTPGTLIKTTTVNTFSSTVYSMSIPSEYKNKQVALIYKAAYDCFTKTGTLTNVTGNLITTQTNVCGKRIDFTITGTSTTDISNYILNKDVSVQLLVDGNLTGSPKTISFSSFPYSNYIDVPAASSPISSNKNVQLSFTPIFSCFSTTNTATYSRPTISLAGDITCASKPNVNTSGVSYSILNVSDPAAYPITLKYVEDNATPTNVADDVTGEDKDILTGSPFTVYSAALMNIKSNVTIYAESNQAGCAAASLSVPNSCVVLPVHFQSFSAARNKQKKEEVILKWVTATEQNNRGFNVQRKVGGQWKTIAFVFSQADNGNSNTPLVYEYKEVNTASGISQYQIQQIDFDGKTSYSDIKSVVGLEQKSSVLVYPNPATDGKIKLLFSEQDRVKEVIVSDMSGRVVKQYRQLTDNNLTIDGLQSGFYTIKITDRSTAVTTVEKVIIK